MTERTRHAINEVVGRMRRLDERAGAVRVESVYDTTVEDLWAAITRPDRLARWVATVDGDPRVGGTVQARFTSGWEGLGRIDVCEAPRRLSLTMQPGTTEETVVEAVITPMDAGARLIVEERGIPLPELPGYGAGWQTHLEDLHADMMGRDAGDWSARASRLMPAYEESARTLS